MRDRLFTPGRNLISAPQRPEITRILHELRSGPEDVDATRNRLFEVVYAELRNMAAGLMRQERRSHTLRPTALVHEAYLRLVSNEGDPSWENRAHFFGVAARAMRQILVEHARRRAAAKRGGDLQRVTLSESLDGENPIELEVLALHEALERLASLDARTSKVIELHVFAGLKLREISTFLDVSPRTVEGDWQFGRSWLAKELA